MRNQQTFICLNSPAVCDLFSVLNALPDLRFVSPPARPGQVGAVTQHFREPFDLSRSAYATVRRRSRKPGHEQVHTALHQSRTWVAPPSSPPRPFPPSASPHHHPRPYSAILGGVSEGFLRLAACAWVCPPVGITSEPRSCVKVQVAVVGSLSLTDRMVSQWT